MSPQAQGRREGGYIAPSETALGKKFFSGNKKKRKKIFYKSLFSDRWDFEFWQNFFPGL